MSQDKDNNEAASAPKDALAMLKYVLPHISTRAVDPVQARRGPMEDAYINTIARRFIEQAEAASASQSSTPVPRVGGNTSIDLTPHLRQFQHNDGSGLVFGYDKAGIDREFAHIAPQAAADTGAVVDLILAYGAACTVMDERAPAIMEAIKRALAAVPPAQPVQMILHCPACGLPHIDAPDERIQWRNIQMVVRELAGFCFGSANQPGQVSMGAAYTTLVNSLSAKDGLTVALEPLPATPAAQPSGTVPAGWSLEWDKFSAPGTIRLHNEKWGGCFLGEPTPHDIALPALAYRFLSEMLATPAPEQEAAPKPIGFISLGVIEHALAQGMGASTYIQAGKTAEFPVAIYTAAPVEQEAAQVVAVADDQSHVVPPFAAPAGQHDWISTGERLPADKQAVAFVVDSAGWSRFKYLDGRVLGGQYTESDGCFSVPGLGLNASHWMPLPPPPEQSAASGSREGRDAQDDSSGEGCATATNTNQPATCWNCKILRVAADVHCPHCGVVLADGDSEGAANTNKGGEAK